MIPIKVSESYVRPGLEARLFPDHPHFLSLDDVYAVFPSGVINQKSFSHSGYTWKLVNRLMANGNNIYLGERGLWGGRVGGGRRREAEGRRREGKGRGGV